MLHGRLQINCIMQFICNLPDLTIVPVSPSTGSVEASSVSAALRPETCLVTVMLANNETGVVQPIREIRDALREKPDHDHNT